MGTFHRTLFLFISLALFAGAFACEGSGGRQSLESALLDYKEIPNVKFTISGNAVCSECDEEELPIDAMQIELYPADSPLNRVGLRIYEGLGPFLFKNVEGLQGTTMEIHAKLLRQGADMEYVTAARGYAEVVVPNDDGDIVSVTLNFPSSQGQEGEEE